MEVDSSVKRVNDSDLEEVSSATQQKRVKTVFETLWDDTNSGVRKSIDGFHALSRAFWTKIS